MDVRMLFGRDQGKIVDLNTEVALEMLKDGRAENPYLDPEVKLDHAALPVKPQKLSAKKATR